MLKIFIVIGMYHCTYYLVYIITLLSNEYLIELYFRVQRFLFF